MNPEMQNAVTKAHEVIAKYRDELFAENNKLRDAVKKHYDQHADDLCWHDDNELYAAFGLPPRNPTVGDPTAMLENCKRFIEKRCVAGGDWKSYAELEHQLTEARAVAENKFNEGIKFAAKTVHDFDLISAGIPINSPQVTHSEKAIMDAHAALVERSGK